MNKEMQERRTEARMLCSDLVEVHWRDWAGGAQKAMANLEDISATGACLQTEAPVPQGAMLQIRHPKIELEGRARYCVLRDASYFIGVEFDEGMRWSPSIYRPQHMLDPRTLVERTLKRLK